jgi:ABC-type lipoprotein export system ATPase subunit
MIKVKDLCKSFQRPGEDVLHVLRNVDFNVDAGEFVAIVGASGSGKTTLMNIIGLLDRADSGSYELQGRSVSDLSPDQRALVRNETIGFVFQQFHLLARTTATENVELPLLYSSRSDSDISKKAREALCRVGLEERLTHYPSELSGGQQQRVAIARALVNDPGVILADEPTGNLDRQSGMQIMELLGELNRNGSTILLITHDENVASAASRVVRIDNGELVETNTGVMS